MGFLYPLALFSALAAAIPILLHFWRREQQQPPNLFPGVYFLVDPAAPVPQKAKPLTWLLTALRTLLVLLLALLIAGPYRPTTQAQALPEHPVLLAVVIDDSPSMGLPVGSLPPVGTAPESRLDRRLAEINRLIDLLPTGSGLIWTTTSGRFHPLTLLPAGGLGGERSALHLTAAQVPISDDAGDLGRAIDRVRQAAQEVAYPERRVLVASDFTVGLGGGATQERVAGALRKLRAAEIPLSLLDTAAVDDSSGALPAPAARLKILSVDRPPLWRVGRPLTLGVEVLFDVAPEGDARRAVAELRWQIGAETVTQAQPIPVQSIDLPCGLRLQRFELARRFAAEGWWKLQVAAQIDEVRQDSLTTYLPVAAPTPVWLVEPPQPAGDSRYLALAIDPAKSGGGSAVTGTDWLLQRKSYADLADKLPEHGVLVLWGAGRGLAGADWDRIAAATAQGMGLWLVPDGGVLPTHADHPWLFWAVDSGAVGGGNGWGAADSPVSTTGLARPAALVALPIRGQRSNPVRSALQALSSATLQAAAVDRYYPVRMLESGTDTLLTLDTGGQGLIPALVEKNRGRGLSLLLTVPPVAGNGGLVQAEVWPLLTGLVLERLAPTVGEWPDVDVGRSLTGQAGAGCVPPFQVTVVAAPETLPAHIDFAAAWPAAAGAHAEDAGDTGHAGGLGATAAAAPLAGNNSRPIGHFFRDGRFHFEGDRATQRSILLLADGRGRLVGVQAAQIAAREWDDTRLAHDFWQGPGTEDPDAAGGRAGVQRAASAAEVLGALRENETRAHANSAIAVTIHGDLSPWLLAAVLLCTLPWLVLERREYAAA